MIRKQKESDNNSKWSVRDNVGREISKNQNVKETFIYITGGHRPNEFDLSIHF